MSRILRRLSGRNVKAEDLVAKPPAAPREEEKKKEDKKEAKRKKAAEKKEKLLREREEKKRTKEEKKKQRKKGKAQKVDGGHHDHHDDDRVDAVPVDQPPPPVRQVVIVEEEEAAAAAAAAAVVEPVNQIPAAGNSGGHNNNITINHHGPNVQPATTTQAELCEEKIENADNSAEFQFTAPPPPQLVREYQLVFNGNYAAQEQHCINSYFSDDLFLVFFHHCGLGLRDVIAASLVSKKWYRAAADLRYRLAHGMHVVMSFGGSKTGALGHGPGATTQLAPKAVSHLVDRLQNPASAAAGEFHSLVSTADGKVWQWGDSFMSEDARSVDPAFTIPRELALDVFVTAVVAGAAHCLARTREGRVYSWGEGKNGQLGHGSNGKLDDPTLIKALAAHTVTHIAAGSRHSLASTDKNQVYAWGEGSWGKLGVDDVSNKTTPTLMSKGTPKIVVAMAAGNHHTLILGKDGVVYSCGGSTYGQLGNGDTDGQRVPRPITKLQGTRIVAIAAGGDHSMVLSVHGHVFTFGNCLFGELGVGGFTEMWEPTQVRGELSQKRVMTIVAGHSHNLCMTEDYEVYSFGQGDHGELGYGEQVSSQPEPRRVDTLGLLTPLVLAAGWQHSLIVTRLVN